VVVVENHEGKYQEVEGGGRGGGGKERGDLRKW